MFLLVIFSSVIPRTEIYTTVVERETAAVIKLQPYEQYFLSNSIYSFKLSEDKLLSFVERLHQQCR